MTKLLSVPEYAKQEGISRQGAWERIKRGVVKAEKVGKSYIMYVEEKIKRGK